MNNNINRVYTIGYGSRKIEDFISILTKYEIQYLLDVRSKPYSGYQPDFSKTSLDGHLAKAGIRYVFLGKNLGGMPDMPSCFTKEGKIDYEVVKRKDFFKEGIERILNAINQNLKVVLMCSEKKPERCHRSKLIGEVLVEKGVKVLHIDEKNQLVSQESIILRLTNGQMNMFGNLTLTSRKPYYEEKNEE